MFKIIWYKNENLVKLVDISSDEEGIQPPRIVYSDELRLLGFEERFKFPLNNGVPVCWGIERKYYYKGVVIAEAREANIYSKPRVIFTNNEFTKLIKININKLLEINKQALFNLENEAMDFVQSVYDKYNKKIDSFVCAFSGGKDSQINLDIVSRVLNPSDYIAVYTDTGMELPCTLDTVIKTRKKYLEKSSDFKLFHARSEVSAEQQWEQIGPPSRFSRWCCSVRKTGLFTRTMKTILNVEKQPRVVVFEGVRGEESQRREKYERIAVGVKHTNLINCRPIFNWNVTEVYLYAIKNDVDLNSAYKLGLTRVGCNICPFASSWSESMIAMLYPNLVRPYVEVIKKMAVNLGITNEDKIKEYISSGNWKKNAGGKGLCIDSSAISIISRKPDLEVIVNFPKSDWKIWLSIIGDMLISKKEFENYIFYDGEIRLDGCLYKLNVTEKKEYIIFKIFNIGNRLVNVGLLLKAISKICYCINCGVCEAECPTGALKIRKDEFTYNKRQCIHCMKCINVHNTGCLVADRRRISEGLNMSNIRTSGVDRYSTFGLKQQWVDLFFREKDEYFIEYGRIGSKMKIAAKNWLREALLIDPKLMKTSELMEVISQFYEQNKKIAWEIIWVNLAFNSVIINTYVKHFDNNIKYSEKDILEQLKMLYPNLNEKTLENPTKALINMMKDNSLFGHVENSIPSSDNLKMGVLSTSSRENYLTKVGNNNVSKVSICYLLYKIAECDGIYEYLISDFYENNENLGPHKMFNLPEYEFRKILLSLANDGLLSVDLAAGLQNIHLKKEFTPLEIIKRMTNYEGK